MGGQKHWCRSGAPPPPAEVGTPLCRQADNHMVCLLISSTYRERFKDAVDDLLRCCPDLELILSPTQPDDGSVPFANQVSQ